MELRSAGPADVGAFADLHARLNQRLLDETQVRAAVAAFPSAVAVEAGDLVGFAYCTRLGGDVLLLELVWVHPDHRHSGIGAQLLNHVAGTAGARWDTMVAVATTVHPRLRRLDPTGFYEACGFTRAYASGSSTILACPLHRLPAAPAAPAE